jgi:exoribonuclease-2
MHVFFEDDGQLRAGTILADNDASLQVEAVSGKRLKVKAAAALLRFSDPAPAALQALAQKHAGELDPNFLWEVCDDGEFGFSDLAREYYGHPPLPVEAAAVALALAAAPMYFYKRGKGRYRRAPSDALAAALASVERKKREAEESARWIDALRAHRLPEPLRAKLPMLLYKPDKNTLEWKALAAACEGLHTNPVALLADCGAIASSHEYHFNAFLAGRFRGIDFRVERCPPPDLRAECGHSRSTTRRRPRSTTPFRWVSLIVATGGSASTSPRPRSRLRAARRWTPSRVPGCRRFTCRAAR